MLKLFVMKIIIVHVHFRVMVTWYRPFGLLNFRVLFFSQLRVVSLSSNECKLYQLVLFLTECIDASSFRLNIVCLALRFHLKQM